MSLTSRSIFMLLDNKSHKFLSNVSMTMRITRLMSSLKVLHRHNSLVTNCINIAISQMKENEKFVFKLCIPKSILATNLMMLDKECEGEEDPLNVLKESI